MQVHRIVLTVLIAFCFSVTHSHHAALAEEAEAIPTKKMTLVVTAPDGSPVVGAKVKPDGLRTIVDPGSHYWWVTKRHGPHPEQLTDNKGEVEITYPKYVDERKETGKVTVTIDHPDFVLYWADQSTSQDRHKIELVKGFQLRIFAVIKHKGIKKVKSRLHGFIYGQTSRTQFEWTSEKQGTFISPAFERGKIIGWAVQITEKPFLFSDTFEIDPTKTEETVNQTRRTLLLKPGYRVEGRIDDAVPRPIKNGQVQIYITPSKRPKGIGGMVWQDVTEINANGTFLFESLPRCEVAQVFASCDGWISATPRGEDFDVLKQGEGGAAAINVNPGRLLNCTYAQVHGIDAKTPFIDLTMEKTVSVEFNVLKPDRSPLAGATVEMYPNLRVLCWGSVIVGNTFPTHEALSLKDPTAYYEKKLKENRHRFSAKTDTRGRAVISNLPARSNIYWGVEHDAFDMPVQSKKATDRSRDIDATQTPIPLQTIVMEKKGTHLLGKKKAEEKP